MNDFDTFKPGDKVKILDLDWGEESEFLVGKTGTVVPYPVRISERVARRSNYIDVMVDDLTKEQEKILGGSPVLFYPEEIEKV